MWTQTRQVPSPVASAEIASSKSRALTGSIVNVGRSRRSRRGWSAGGVSAAARALHRQVGSDPRALLDAAAAQVVPVGREVLTDGDVERTSVGQFLDLLEDALAERAGAHDLGPAALLQGGGDDLRCGGGVVVDEDDDREAPLDRSTRG